MNSKDKLPYPYNLDLSAVLKGLARRTPLGRSRLANDPVTAAYLTAGMRLLECHLGPAAGSLSNADGAASTERPLLKILSQRAVADEVANNPDPFVRAGSTSTLRSTWRTQPDFIADLLRFALWSEHYMGRHAETMATRAEQLIDGPDPIEAIYAVSHSIVAMHMEHPRWRLQLLAAATAEGDPVIGRAMTENYRDLTRTWQPIFEDFMRARGLRLRPGITLEDMTCLMVAATEGLSLRAIADAETQVVGEGQRSLLGTFALAFLVGCTQPAGDEDGLTLEGAFDLMTSGDQSAAPG